MTNTERKLDEARYFLNKLIPHYPYFDYILSAYLNAARSTTWIMRNEFSQVDGWEEWFKNCEISEEEVNLLKNINQLRILSTKQSGIKTKFRFADFLIPDEEYLPAIEKLLDDLEEGEEVTMTLSEVGTNDISSLSEEEHMVRGRVKLTKDQSEMSRESIDNLCKRYFIFLEKKVNDCVRIFSNK